ncbi:hypothetical protein J7F02_34075 [Streptomyces sp. ISL-112]|uniref:hypothetical protein n=1 Tax=unclassified Streptomyces TaxID=2593676 RepID=UPI001BE503CA|nr:MULTISPECIES: hypothetical protein [unclassified Streptomyces]MBT2430471.1 hypothetical protein [Streptomyces sp. ISL-112]MBT2466172.1 hypothetical protein [Streptomyces sp. ISL-63]
MPGDGDEFTDRAVARVVSAVMFPAMAASVNIAASVDEIARGIREQIAVPLKH